MIVTTGNEVEGHSIAEYIGIYERARREFPAAPRLHDLLDVEARRTKKGGRR